MLKCKHYELQQKDNEELAEKKKNFREYTSEDDPCRLCGTKVKKQETKFTDYDIRYFKSEGWDNPPKTMISFYCPACYEESKRQAEAGETVSMQEMMDELVESYGYGNYKTYRDKVIEEVAECGPECVWWSVRKDLIKDIVAIVSFKFKDSVDKNTEISIVNKLKKNKLVRAINKSDETSLDPQIQKMYIINTHDVHFTIQELNKINEIENVSLESTRSLSGFLEG